MMDSVLAPAGDLLLQQAGPTSGKYVLDIGCGAGATSLRAARIVVPDGMVTGLDVSGPLIGEARRRLANAKLTNATFEHGDAAHWSAPAPYDIAMSRFGVMFFDDPPGAFANIRKALKPGGEMVAITWNRPELAELFSLPKQVISPFLKYPPPAQNLYEPGPFGLSDEVYTRKVLEQAGWSDISITAQDLVLKVAPEHIRDFYNNTPLPALVDAQELDEGPIRAAFTAALEDRRDDSGSACLKSGVWVVRARA